MIRPVFDSNLGDYTTDIL